MEENVLQELGMTERNEAVRFLKRLWLDQPTACPKCGCELEHLHKKAKKSSCDWMCPDCHMIYRTINILNRLNERKLSYSVAPRCTWRDC